MASRDDYTVGWVCALPIEVAAAKATLDRIHDNLPPDQCSDDDSNCYILGSLHGHHVVVAYPKSGVYGETSVAGVATQLHASFKSVQFNLMVGIAGGVPDTKEDIRLGDVVVGKSTAGLPGVVQCDVDGEPAQDRLARDNAVDQPTPLLLAAIGKTETAAMFDESKMSQYISEMVQKDPAIFARPDPEQDVVFEPDYDHTATEAEESGCDHCNPDMIRPRQPRETQDPTVHYGLIASGHHWARQGATRDKLAQKQGILCLETEASGLQDVARYLVIRGICDYADSHSSELWHAYAAIAAAAYAKEVLSFIPSVTKTITLATNTYPEAAPVLDALLLTRPDVDRKSLIALKGHRVDGTCEWLVQHPSYQEWVADANLPLLWISGGPGKGKTMLAIYLTEVLQPVVDAADDVLLYYFCSSRDKKRNSSVTIMRGIMHQWIGLHPELAQEVKSSFEGTETTKYTVSNFVSLWQGFLTLLRKSTCAQVVCVLDGLDECDKDSLGQLLDAIRNHLSSSLESTGPRLKLIVISRPRPAVLENKLGRYQQIRLDDSETDTSNDVERYIFARVAELKLEQDLSEEMAARIGKALLAGADGTFLWVGFVTNELSRSWGKIDEVLLRMPRGLGGVYQRLLQQIDDKEALLPILQWVVLAARPLTVGELTVAAKIEASGSVPATEVVKRRLGLGGLLVKIEGDVVNLVHESAKEFFQSDLVNIKDISMFHMNQNTHRTLMQTCLSHLERGYGATGRVDESSGHDDPLLSYASQNWSMHFHHAMDVIDAPSEFSRPFFEADSPVREKWLKVYWEQEKNGGNPPSFTLLHLAAYLGNMAWAKMLISENARLISRKDNYGRTPLYWAVDQGHRALVDLLIDHGARFNFKDRSTLTALHIAATGQHKDVVSVLLDHGAHLETKTEHNDTPLIRAILANSREIVQILLEHGARVDGLPTPPGVTLRASTDPMQERVNQILGLQHQIFLTRYKAASRKVEMVMKAFSLSFHIPLAFRLVTIYLRFVALGRWENLSVLQELVRENRTDELRQWTKRHREFFCRVVVSRSTRKLKAISDLPSRVLLEVAPSDLNALLVISVMVGSAAKLTACREGWREGDAIMASTFSNFASVAYNRGAEEFLHQGVRDYFVNTFDPSIQSGNREDNVACTMLLVTTHMAIIERKEPRPIEYFARVIAEFFEGYIGGSYEVELFSSANRGCARELSFISEGHDSKNLLLLLTSIFEIAQCSQEKGQDRFLNIPSTSCLMLCQENARVHRWLIGEAIPETLSALIAKLPPGSLQKRACKTFVECLIIGKQHGLVLPAGAIKERVKQHLRSLPEVEYMMTRIVG